MLELSVAVFIALSPTLVRPEPEPLEVVGGTTAGVCDFPADVFIGSSNSMNCTASLVHPRVIVTAAHCLGSISRVGFGESASSPAATVSVAGCQGHPSYNGGAGPDIAFCTLSEDAPQVDMVPVIMGCEIDELQPGREIVIAGFGQNDELSGSGAGTKRYTSNTVDYLSEASSEIYLLGNQNGSCFGDSGGPAYIQLADGSWRVIAAVQGPHPNAPPLGCGYGGTYTLVHPFMDWIETNSGYDITPCFDADGTWNPDERCGGFPTELTGFGSQWSTLCEGADLSGPGESCGAPHGDAGSGGGESEGGSTGDESAGSTGLDDSGAELTTGVPPDGGSTSGGADDDDATPTDDDDAEPTDDDEPADDDDNDDDDDDAAGSRGALPAQYGHNNAGAGCSVGNPADVTPSWLLIGLLGLVGRRRAR